MTNPPLERNVVETVIARASHYLGEMVLTRTEFDVWYKNGVGDGPWLMERQASYTITGDGLHSGGQDEARARARWARSLALFNAQPVT